MEQNVCWVNQRAAGPHPRPSVSPLPLRFLLAVAYVDVGKNMVKWTSEGESEEGGGGMAGDLGGADIGRRAHTQQRMR